MGQAITKLYIVNLGSGSSPENNIYGSIQEAINNADPGTTIVLSSGDHVGVDDGPIVIRSGIKFLGLEGSRIIAPLIGDSLDVTFENITFANYDNQPIEFVNSRGLLFKGCQFIVKLLGTASSSITEADIRFAIHINSGSALFQNCIFDVTAENIDILIVMGATNDASYLSLQAPIIRVQYKDIIKIETFYFKGVKKSPNVPYIESFSISAHYINIATNAEYNCKCIPSSNKNKSKNNGCCQKVCQNKRQEAEQSTYIRLFRGLYCVNASFNGTKLNLVGGSGTFNIASNNSLIYINALTVSSSNNKWSVGYFRNILLSSFMSNLIQSCDIKECPCIDASQIKEPCKNHKYLPVACEHVQACHSCCNEESPDKSIPCCHVAPCNTCAPKNPNSFENCQNIVQRLAMVEVNPPGCTPDCPYYNPNWAAWCDELCDDDESCTDTCDTYEDSAKYY